MKKIYTCVFFTALSVTLFAQDEVLSLSLYNLTKERVNTTHLDNQNNSIKIETLEPTNSKGEETLVYAKTAANPLECALETPSLVLDEYTYIYLEGNISYTSAKSPGMVITLPADDKITAIEVLGFGSNAASQSTTATVAIGFSADGTTYEVDEDMFNPFIRLKQTDCAPASYNKRDVLPGTKYIKLLHTSDYLGIDEINMESKPQIHAIRFYAKDMGTSISGGTDRKLEIRLYGRNLQLSQTADVTIYDITGKAVAQYRDIKDTYLDFLTGGLYVIMAVDKNGNKAIQKVAVK